MSASFSGFAFSWIMTILEPAFDRRIKPHPLWRRRAVALTFPISIPLIMLALVVLVVAMWIEMMIRTFADVIANLWRE
jgi:hypothetical protein